MLALFQGGIIVSHGNYLMCNVQLCGDSGQTCAYVHNTPVLEQGNQFLAWLTLVCVHFSSNQHTPEIVTNVCVETLLSMKCGGVSNEMPPCEY